MDQRLIIPDSAVKYILFQRTQYLKLPQTFVYRKIEKFMPFPIYNYAVILEAIFSKARIKAAYQEDMRKEYLTVKPFLPSDCSAVLEIGCGVGGFAAYLNQHYGQKSIHFYLLDKTYIEPNVYYMFNPKGAFYNSLSVTKRLLADSCINSDRIHLIEASDNNKIEVNGKVDLVISFLSWGFHYPVETYLNGVYDCLSDDGIVIADIRKETGGEKILQKMFKNIELIIEAEKFLRVLARK